MRDINQAPSPAELLNKNNRLLLWVIIMLAGILCCEVINTIQTASTNGLIIDGFNRLFGGVSVIIDSMRQMKVY